LSVMVAPEGTRLDTTEVGPFKMGAFRIAMAAGIPIVPIVIRNAEMIAGRNDAWRRTVSLAIQGGVGTPAFSASLAYYDSYRRERLPANLIQAQRDFFGAHTYERVDKPGQGPFHTEWST